MIGLEHGPSGARGACEHYWEASEPADGRLDADCGAGSGGVARVECVENGDEHGEMLYGNRRVGTPTYEMRYCGFSARGDGQALAGRAGVHVRDHAGRDAKCGAQNACVLVGREAGQVAPIVRDAVMQFGREEGEKHGFGHTIYGEKARVWVARVVAQR